MQGHGTNILSFKDQWFQIMINYDYWTEEIKVWINAVLLTFNINLNATNIREFGKLP